MKSDLDELANLATVSRHLNSLVGNFALVSKENKNKVSAAATRFNKLFVERAIAFDDSYTKEKKPVLHLNGSDVVVVNSEEKGNPSEKKPILHINGGEVVVVNSAPCSSTMGACPVPGAA